MNYRHHFHAGNFADVVKHVLLVPIVQALQRKEKGILFLDTHAGRGAYDLSLAARGDSLARQPEHPEGIGRIRTTEGLPPAVAKYLEVVESFDRERGNADGTLRYYPGSPWFLRSLARLQDRVAACELHSEDFAVLKDEFFRVSRVSVQLLDGYTAIRAMLPPPEKRALVLIDPPYENQHEVDDLLAALSEGLKRSPAATFAIWYPLTARVNPASLEERLRELSVPIFAAEVAIAGVATELRMRGCGLVVINPPWQVDREIAPVLPWLAAKLAQVPGAGSRLTWIVPEA